MDTLLETLHGRLPYGIAVFDADLRLVHANAPWSSFRDQATAGGGPASAGTPIAELLPDNADLLDAARAARSGETVRLPGQPVATEGGERYWDVTFSPLLDGDVVTGLICVVDDATNRILAERAAAAKARLAAFRADVSQALASSDEIGAVLQACAEAMVRHAPAAFARIWVLDEAEDTYRLRASAGLYTRLNGTYSRIPAEWIRQKTFSGHSPSMAIDILKTHDVRDPEWAAAQGLVAWASHPLAVRGQIIGFMAMFARQNFDSDTLAELAAVADAIAQFLERKHAEAVLREREVLFRSTFESTSNGLIISDLETGQVLEVNPAAVTMHGYPRDEMTGLSREVFVDPGSHARLRDFVATVSGGKPARAQLRHRRKDGSSFPAAVLGSQIFYQGRPAVLGVIRDVTQEQEAQERLEQRVAERTRELSLLLDITRGVASTLELKPLLELILDQLKSVVDYTGTAILTLEGDELRIAGQRGPLSDEAARAIRYPVSGMSAVWDRLSRGEAIIVPDVRGETPEAGVFRALVGGDLDGQLRFIGSCLWAPMVVKDRLIGFLSITRQETGGFDPEETEMAAAIARQAAVAIENARLFEQAQGKAALEERQKLARELHDSVSQALYGIGLGTRTARTLLDRDPARAAEPLDYVMSLAEAGMAEMRALIFELRPESLEQEGLRAALEKQAAATRARHGIAVDLSLPPAEPEIPLDVKEALYRIAQEAMHNTVKHARASRITLSLGDESGTLTLDVIDDGIGFDSSGSFPGHLGLVSMRERVNRSGGRVEIESAPGKGTAVRVTLPLR